MVFVITLVLASGFLLDQYESKHVAQAVENIKSWVQSPIIKTNTILEANFQMSIIKIKDRVMLEAPVINQFPELPRGCEVTSLAMLLQYAGIDINKMTLAEEIKKDPTKYRVEDGKTYFGNPYDGFVGDMYTYNNPGLGVYHLPIKELAEKHLPGRIKDFTGADFEEIKTHLSDNRPVWVITNTKYTKLRDDQFQTWHTPSGKIDVTFKEHSVLITGYDEKYIYFNDPLTGEKNKKAPIKDFEESWVQMGRQAITYLHT